MTEVTTVNIRLYFLILIKLRVQPRKTLSPTFQMKGCNLTCMLEQAKSSTYKLFVGKGSKLGQTWNCTWKFTQTRTRSLTAASTARKSLISAPLCRGIFQCTQEKPYECRMCGKRSNVSTTLKVHYRIHTGKKPYKWKAFERAFTTCSNLKKCMALHTKVGSRHVRSYHCINNFNESCNEMV